ncbi:YDG/SRA domain-containing protein [Streptomyces sp. NPDC042319]|uniref:YDG/SRA domain-containing protein n=1 Tax=Streptomyces sp. NPDC042319 TaxID=3154332 RepID=UPI0033ECDAD3
MAKSKVSKSVSFGTPPGVLVGDWFKGHRELYDRGVHRAYGQGISGTARDGVDSIVLSGGYVDDVYGDEEITYTGEGGRDRMTGHLFDDQTMDSPGNAGLLLDEALGHPVRVIRGLNIKGGKRRRATGGYEYCGLFRVADHWMTVGKEGFRVCQFKLVKLVPGEVPKPKPVSPNDDQDTDFENQVRRTVERERRVRDSAVVREVKELYKDTCQICRKRLVVSPAGEAYSEAAHIQAMGKPHNGPDKVWNVLCLCPNCHALFDRGALQLTDDLNVIDGLTQKFMRALHRAETHAIKVECVRLHRARWAGRLVE